MSFCSWFTSRIQLAFRNFPVPGRNSCRIDCFPTYVGVLAFTRELFPSTVSLPGFANKLGRYRGYILEGYPTTFAEAEVQTLQIPDWLCTSQHSLQFRDSLCCFVSGKVIPIAGKPHLGIVHGKGARRRGWRGGRAFLEWKVHWHPRRCDCRQ